jgi:DNA mismatch repair protein MutS2
MSFRVSQKTLQRLEWEEILERLEGLARTPRGRARFATGGESIDTSLFEASLAGVRERLAETGEARAILHQGDRPPISGVADVDVLLKRARKGGVLSARELLDVGSTLVALRGVARFLQPRHELAPRLAEVAGGIDTPRDLESDIERCIDASGELLDAASPALAAARRESRSLASEIQQRVERSLRDPGVEPHLSDHYYTVRNDRYVLPVRADSRGSVRGIVHDASSSGATLFIEPEALVDLNNRHKRAELEIERETLRVLRDLSARTARAGDSLETGIGALEIIDLAFSRANLADEMGASAPEVSNEGVLRLPQLRHPLIPNDQAVANDVRLGESFRVLVISGPNAGGKTVTLKAVALAALFARAGLHVVADAGARVDLFDSVYADIGDEQDIRDHLSTFSAHMANLATTLRGAGEGSLVALDEIGVGTDPGEGAVLAQAVLEALAEAGARVVTTTHYNLLKEMAAVDPRFANASVEFDPETGMPTYRIRLGSAGASSATTVAARMGVPGRVIDRANELLAREDRTLDRTLTELATARAALDREQREASKLRLETEAARDEYRGKLEALRDRRDALYRTMRSDLDSAFRDAHAQVGAVIAELQRKGSAQEAARAREKLETLAEEAQRAEEAAGLTSAPEEPSDPIDWRFAKPGDPVRVRNAGPGTLIALPDSRGRCEVQVGSARVVVSADRIERAELPAPPPAAPSTRVRVDTEASRQLEAGEPDSDTGRCDLRGLRVDEALDRLVYALDRAASAGRGRIAIVHGLGTGALRDAVRRHLSQSPYVTRFQQAEPDEGGAGVTTAELE